ncbi:hypothetical protein FY048_07785 [Acinetobacter sp. 1124_18A]|uniref:hypothetical protein n=1 Tax=unclassified Acinetobacter TaxID=196816 RepID=UPI0021CD6622|nr:MULTISPECIES: hypothetical protein [unclassified Acinetobacter]MCU4425281.1 hypothetical protein [Acinetobacter sp. WU_MDCI_Abxb74]MEB3864511.1 hypothetical protein [Acinetobacter sp. IK31]
MIKELNFELKYSRFSIIFQLFIGLSLAILLYQLLSPIWWLIALILLSISFLFFLKKSRISQIAYLDQKSWSVAYSSQKMISRVEITKIINYQLFMVIYFEGAPMKVAIIWFDQLPLQHWKKLKVLQKVY